MMLFAGQQHSVYTPTERSLEATAPVFDTTSEIQFQVGRRENGVVVSVAWLQDTATCLTAGRENVCFHGGCQERIRHFIQIAFSW